MNTTANTQKMFKQWARKTQSKYLLAANSFKILFQKLWELMSAAPKSQKCIGSSCQLPNTSASADSETTISHFLSLISEHCWKEQADLRVSMEGISAFLSNF